MANSLSAIMAKILAKSLISLREQAIMPRLVNGDYSAEAKEKGDTIDVPIPTAKSAYDVSPSAYLSAVDTTPTKVQIELNNWKGSNFKLSDKDMGEIDRNAHYMPMQINEAIRAIANEINDSIHSEYTGVYGFTGTGGTTPFASTVNGATDSRKILNQQLAPRSDRRGVLDFDAEANALALSQFADADKTMSAMVKMEGEIGRKYGIDWAADDAVKTHTAGTLQAYGGLVGSTTAANASSLDIKSASGTGNLVIGDIFTIAGNTQTYAVKATVSAIASGAAKAVTIDPPLKAIASSGAAITIKPTHVVNLVFHRDAFAFANRALMQSTNDAIRSVSSNMMTLQDPKTGLVMRLEVTRQNKQVVWEVDVLWGAKLVRAPLATRLAG